MSDKDLKKTINTVASIDVHSETQAIAKELLMNYAEQLQEENKELTRLVTNKLVTDYNYDSILKKELNEERLKYIALEESKNEIENTINDFEKWLDKELEVVYRDCGHKHNILQEIMYKLQELKIERCNKDE